MLDMIVSFLAKLASETIQGVVSLLMPLLDFTFDTFVGAFPYAAQAFPIIQRTSLVIALLLAALELLFMRSSRSKTNPVRLAGFLIASIFGIYFGNYLLVGIMELAQMPYMALLAEDATSWSNWSFSSVEALISSVTYQQSLLLYVIILILVGIAFIKMLLEAVERYAMVFLLIYLSPLGASALATEASAGIAKRYVTMFLSQCLLMILNIWSLKMTISLFNNLSAASIPLLNLLVGYAFMRLAAKLDSYMNQLGLSAAVTGVGLGGEIMATGMMLAGRFGGKGGPVGGSGGEKGGVLGLSQMLTAGYGKISPLAGLGKAAGNAMGAVGKTIKDGIGTAIETASGTDGGIAEKIRAAASGGGNSMRSNFGANMHAASEDTKNASLWVRGVSDAVDRHDGRPDIGEAIKEDAPLSPQQRQDISTTPYLAARAFNSVARDGAVNRSGDVAAVMKGTGITRAVPEAETAINVGYGNTDAEAVQYNMDNGGISASYIKDGKEENWNIKNQAQYDNLPQEEQSAYSRYADGNGSTYFYRHETNRAPTDFQREKTTAAAAVQNWAADPGNAANIDSASFATMRKDPRLAYSVYDQMGQNGSKIQYKYNEKESENEKRLPELRHVASHIESMNLANVSPKDKNDVVMHLRSGEVENAVLSGNGTQVEWQGAQTYNRLTIMTKAGAAANDLIDDNGNVDESYLSNAGYAHTDLGGQDVWAKVDHIPIGNAKNNTNLETGKDYI